MCDFLTINDVEIEYIKINGDGMVDVNDLKRLLARAPVDLVSVQWVNNEAGIMQNIDEIIDICAEQEVPFHTDAAQSVGKIKFSVKDIDVDYLTLAGHKFHAPQGIGAIYVKEKITIHPLLFGGFQEEGFRPGTENLPGIVGMGKACELRSKNIDETIRYMSELRNTFEYALSERIEGIKINGAGQNRICNTSNVMFGGVDGRELVKYLDREGVRCSQSSACTNMDSAPSYVLRAMGMSEKDVYSSIRFSFSEENTVGEIDAAIEIIIRGCRELRN